MNVSTVERSQRRVERPSPLPTVLLSVAGVLSAAGCLSIATAWWFATQSAFCLANDCTLQVLSTEAYLAALAVLGGSWIETAMTLVYEPLLWLLGMTIVALTLYAAVKAGPTRLLARGPAQSTGSVIARRVAVVVVVVFIAMSIAMEPYWAFASMLLE